LGKITRFHVTMSLKDGMPGTDAAGAAGCNDQVNHDFVRVFSQVLLLSVLSAGGQLSHVPSFGQGFTGTTAGNVLGAPPWRQELDQTSSELIRRGMNIAPTIEIRPTYALKVMVIQDLVFPGPSDDTVRPMRLKPIQSFRAVALKGRIPGELHVALTDSTTY
jgi:type IV secretory pathway VirB10-like protein